MTNESGFVEARQAYIDCRNRQTQHIAARLRTMGLEAVDLTELVDKNDPPYDLSLWKFVYVRGADKACLISLQAFDVDHSSTNRHVLMDRLGVYEYAGDPVSSAQLKAAFAGIMDLCKKEKLETGIDLPMEREKWDCLLGLLAEVLSMPAVLPDPARAGMPEPSDPEFEKAKEKYEECKEKEWTELRKYLRGKGYTVKGGGYGASTYGKAYDLSNWRWIDACLDGILYSVCLQAFDDDPKKRPYHFLMDTLGVYYCREDHRLNKKQEAAHADRTMVNTGICLPLDASGQEKLRDFLREAGKNPIGMPENDR